MKGWVREVAQHHAREGPSRIASRAASCATSCLSSIMRNITRSFTRGSVKTQRSAQEKLTGNIFSKRGAKLAHQNLQKLRRDIDVFTLTCSGRVSRVYLTCFYASGPPVVKLNPILFGVSCRDIFPSALTKWKASLLSTADAEPLGSRRRLAVLQAKVFGGAERSAPHSSGRAGRAFY